MSAGATDPQYICVSGEAMVTDAECQTVIANCANICIRLGLEVVYVEVDFLQSSYKYI